MYERQERIDARAMGHSHIEIAARFGISVQASKMFKPRNKAEVEERARHFSGQLAEETARLWVSDPTWANLVRSLVDGGECLVDVVSDKPTATVAEHFGWHQRTAALYVKRARERGFLGAAIKGRAGEK